MKTSMIAIALLLSGPAHAGPSLQDAHPSFSVGTATAQRGQRAYGVLKVPAGSDAGYDIPVAVVHGAKPGPVLAIVSGAHGTEYASIVAVQQLIDAVKPADLSGTLILVPLVNVPSFEKLTPHVNPTDNKSMNSRYPGDPAGTQTDRASAVITKAVVEQCDHLIDLHGGDLDENLRPYSYWTVTGNQKQDQDSRAMLLAFGLDHIIISDRPKDPKASRFLENTATTRGKASFTAEAGRSGPVVADAGRKADLGRENRVGAGRSRRGVPRLGRSRRARGQGREDWLRHRLSQPSAPGHHGARSRHRHVHSRRAVVEER
jgi:predicted deacylase